jgi:hypothetical protein
MSAKNEAKTILKGVAKGLSTVIFPPKKDEKPSETIELHWCDKCKKYHRAG